MSPGTVMIGAVVSAAGFTVTLNDAVPVLPTASVASQFTIVSPIGNVEADTGVHVTGTIPSTSSTADTSKETVAPCGLVASSVMSPGTVMIGAVVFGDTIACEPRSTVTLKVPLALLPELSVASQLTGFVPKKNTEPEPGSHEILMSRPSWSSCMSTPSFPNVALPSTMSVALTKNLTLVGSQLNSHESSGLDEF